MYVFLIWPGFGILELCFGGGIVVFLFHTVDVFVVCIGIGEGCRCVRAAFFRGFFQADVGAEVNAFFFFIFHIDVYMWA